MINYSFIIPHHNAPELLNRCLDSIPKREDIQIIVVDDNSQEDKLPKVNRKDVEVYYIDAAHTKGAGHARNVGLAHAKGKWLLFPDSDDYYTSQFINALDKYKNLNIDVLYFNYSHIRGESNEEFPENKLQSLLSSYSGNSDELTFIKYRNNTPWSKMVQTSFVKKHNMFFEEVVNGNDALFSQFIAYYSTKVEVLKCPIYCYVQNQNSLGTKRHSDNDVICRLTNIYHHIYYNRFIHHSEWNKALFKYQKTVLMRCDSRQRTRIILKLFSHSFMIFHNRKKWIKYIIAAA